MMGDAGDSGGDLHEGGCLCGAIRYAARGTPARVTICHCRFCQRATGAACMVEPIFEEAAIVLTSGAPRSYTHRSEGSGKQVYVHFCADCGTKLWLSFERFPGFVGLYIGTFDDPAWIGIGPDNAKQIFLDVARPDAVILPGINAFGQHASLNDGTPLAPKLFDHLVTVAEGWPPPV